MKPSETHLKENLDTIAFLKLEFEQKLKFIQQHQNNLEAHVNWLENALAEARDLYQNAPCGYHSLDENGIVVRINDTELAWLGYERDEVVGKMHISQFHTPESYARVRQTYDSFKTRGQSYNVEYTFQRKDGSSFPVLLSATAIYDENGHYKMSRSVIVDISARKQLECQLVDANEKLFVLNAEKDRFIGMTSHDLQNPITAIAMTAELLQKTGGNLTELQRKLLRNIRQSTERMSQLIKNVLSLNRIERGVVKPLVQPLNIKTYIWDVINRYTIFAEKKGILITFQAFGNDWNVETDGQYLVQIIENLLSNAVKFSPERKNIWVHLRDDDDHFAFSIRDEGAGIKEEELPFLFGKYQQLSARPTGGEQSTGLGLSLVKEYVELLRGQIAVESTWQVGSVFTVRLPKKLVV